MLAAAAVALPDAGATGTTLETRHSAAILEGARTPSPTAPMCARSSLKLTPALHEDRTEVPLAAYDLGHEELKVRTRRQDHSDVDGRHSRHSRFVGLQAISIPYRKESNIVR